METLLLPGMDGTGPTLTWMAAAFGAPLFRTRLPDLALRVALLGADAESEDLRELREVLDSVAPRGLAHRVGEVARVDVTASFVSSAIPTLYLAGARDRLMSVAVMNKLKRLRPDIVSYVLDAPHLVLQQARAEASALVNAFLLPLARE
jgi:pimeloyl-ACP methyl ester carboxylesterase